MPKPSSSSSGAHHHHHHAAATSAAAAASRGGSGAGARPVGYRRPRKETSEISPLIKYLLFGFNVILWLVGILVFGVGIYAWIEKDTFTRLSNLSIGVLFDPAFLFLVVGAFVFVIGFCGCVGALRENTNLLLVFSFALGIIFFAELALGILIFMYKDKVKDEIKQNLSLMITNYREDEDLQDLIDWIQRDWLRCCGISIPDDWDKNQYFECKTNDPWIESCGVPHSCCYPDYMQNRQCGYGVRNKTRLTAATTGGGAVATGGGGVGVVVVGSGGPSVVASSNGGDVVVINKIYQEGCLKKGEEWLKTHILPVSIVVVCFAVLQILGICSAQSLRNDINTQKSRWYRDHPRMR